MKKRVMAAQRANFEEYLSKEFLEVETIHKYTIDSVIDDKVRIITSISKKPIPRTIKIEELAKFEMWKESDIETIEKRNAFKKYGIRSNQIRETRVFVKFPQTLRAREITEFVRQESKNHYLPLLKREHTRLLREREQL